MGTSHSSEKTYTLSPKAGATVPCKDSFRLLTEEYKESQDDNEQKYTSFLAAVSDMAKQHRTVKMLEEEIMAPRNENNINKEQRHEVEYIEFIPDETIEVECSPPSFINEAQCEQKQEYENKEERWDIVNEEIKKTEIQKTNMEKFWEEAFEKLRYEKDERENRNYMN